MALPPILSQRLRLPVIASPLFIISGPDLVIAQCKAGVVGSFPSLNARPISQLDEWLARITEELADWDRKNPDRLSAPFAVNQIVHKTNNRLDEDVALCKKYNVPLVITSLGANVDMNTEIHSWGGVILHDVINDKFARKAIEKGADGLIPVAAGAGGHAGGLSPFALMQELRQWFDGPIALSGAIACGRSVLAAQAMGADLAYMGSAFIATKEANAVQGYKDMIVESSGEDIVYSNLFTGVHGNYLRPSIERAGQGLEGHLGLWPGHWRAQRHPLGGRLCRPAGGGVRDGQGRAGGQDGPDLGTAPGGGLIRTGDYGRHEGGGAAGTAPFFMSAPLQARPFISSPALRGRRR